uniref:VWFA domain-containing protein n=1 Tax=Serratia phage Kevin TaxID=3161161 RepID=A0AAU8L096_9CAUD
MISSLVFKDAVKTPAPTNHIFVADISYSMCNALPKLRAHLKNNLAQLVKENDTVSILYFSSKGQFGPVFIGEPVRHISDLSDINKAIDRYLVPTGCTGFVEPLQLAVTTANDLRENGNNNSLIFMTDGYDNEWTESKILDAADKLNGAFDNITFIEYGWNCNRPLLEKMAAITGALHVFAEGWEQYAPAFEEVLAQSASKRINIDVPESASHIVYLDGDRVQVNVAHLGKATIPEHVNEVWALNKDIGPSLASQKNQTLLYAVLYYAVHTMEPDLAWATLKALGDVRFIKLYNNCFTKQDYSTFKELVQAAVFDQHERLAEGYDPNLVPDENAPTVVDVLEFLAEKDVNIDVGSPQFSYSRIGAATVQKADDTEDQLAEQIANAATKEERKALALQLAEAQEWTPEFKANPGEALVPVNTLVYNSSRPNISVQTSRYGTISVPAEVRKAHPGLPAELDSLIYRNYTIVRDGIINMKSLPIDCTPEVVAELFAMGARVYGNAGKYVLDLTSVPLINRGMTRGIKATEHFADSVRLEDLKARQKVLKFYRDQLSGPKSNAVGLAGRFGVETAEYLSAHGIRDYGFSPKTESVESTDFYYSKELNVKIKGLSSLPSVNAVRAKLEKSSKLNAGDALIAKHLKSYDDFVATPAIANAAGKDKIIDAWLRDEAKAAIQEVRNLNKRLSKTLYAIVAGHAWFADLDFEDTTLDVTVDGVTYTVTAVLEDKEVKI